MKFASILYKILYFDVRYCRLGACFVSKQRFRGLKSVHDFGLSHKIDDYGPIKEVRGNQTSDKASWIYWLRCGLCRLWPLGHFYTAINLFGKLFVRMLPFGHRLMGHHGCYGDRFVNWITFFSPLDVYGPIRTLVAGTVGPDYFSISTHPTPATILGKSALWGGNVPGGLVLGVVLKVDHV